jgi:hypothetical protein
MYPALIGVSNSWPEWNAMRPHPIYRRGLGRLVGDTGFGSAGIDRFCHLMLRQQTWQESQNSDQSSLACRCGNRFSDFQAWRFVPGVRCRPLGGHSLCGQRRPVSFSFVQNRPGHARHFVGQSDSSYLRSFARRQSFQPGSEARVLLGPELQHRMRSLHEKFSQVLVSTSAGPGELLLASGGVFSWNHAEPCGKSSALLEGCPVADGCDRSRSDGRSDSRDRHQPQETHTVS